MNGVCRRCGADVTGNYCSACGSAEVDRSGSPDDTLQIPGAAPVPGQPSQGQPLQGQPLQGQPQQGQPLQGQAMPGRPPATGVPVPPTVVPPAPPMAVPVVPMAYERSHAPVGLAVVSVLAVAAIVAGYFVWSSGSLPVTFALPGPTTRIVQVDQAAQSQPVFTVTQTQVRRTVYQPAPATSTRTIEQVAASGSGTSDAVGTDDGALGRLQSQAASDGARVSKDGRWVAQVASKYVGVYDARQTTSSGSHTFFASDIWDEYQQLTSRFSGLDVVLLDSRTYGRHRNHNGDPLYVTSVLSSAFTDEASVKSWCSDQFPGLSGKDLENVCTPNRLKP